MKYHGKAGAVIEGTPEEIVAYHAQMFQKMSGKVRRDGSRRRAGGFALRAAYDSTERSAILRLANGGSTAAQISRHLWRKKLSPIPRTPSAIAMEISRMLADPERR